MKLSFLFLLSITLFLSLSLSLVSSTSVHSRLLNTQNKVNKQNLQVKSKEEILKEELREWPGPPILDKSVGGIVNNNTHHGPMDKLIANQLSDANLYRSTNFFDQSVFQYIYYLDRHPQLKKQGIKTSKDARRHWIEKGLKLGWRASPLFDVKIYLSKNADVTERYGPTNYFMAIVHYLNYGVYETYRETGGPSRINLFDDSVFNWQWYLRHNPALKSVGVDNEDNAKLHWRNFGIDQGLQASPHVKLSTYLRSNKDILDRYGENNFRAALSHWLHYGVNQTWRENGGSTCKYWANWCQSELIDQLVQNKPELPVYGTPQLLVDPPIPASGGYHLEVNGRRCTDRRQKAELPSTSTRVAEITELKWPGVGRSRPCHVFVRHFVDIQTRVQLRSPSELYLTNWRWNNTTPDFITSQPIATPNNFIYSGYHWKARLVGDRKSKRTIEEEDTDVDYEIINTRGEDTSDPLNVVQAQTVQDPTIVHLPLTTIYDIVHSFSLGNNAVISSSNVRQNNDSPGVTLDMIENNNSS